MLRIAVLMKTDIANSTRQFRALLQDDLQSLLLQHRTSLERLAGDWGGQIVRAAGDGYWLEFPSVTSAAKAAIRMQEELRLEQPTKGDARLSMRIVIGLGEVGDSDGELIGEVFALITRIEAITPADEIYLTAAAHHMLAPAEIQAALVDSFELKGFAEPIQVYRVHLRHRTHIIGDASIVLVDLRGFTKLWDSASISAIERALDALETTTRRIAHGLAGNILFNDGDSFLLNFSEPCDAIAAAEQLERAWNTLGRADRGNCGIHLVAHCGKLYYFRSFIFGRAMGVANRVMDVSRRLLADGEGGVFVTGAVRDRLPSVPWHDRLHVQSLEFPKDQPIGPLVYRLSPA
jgi:class 3 adenylate cyclase